MSSPSLYVARPIHYEPVPQHEASMRALTVECLRRDIRMHDGILVGESLPQRARNVLVHRFLKTDYTHLLFIDADLMFDPRDVFRMLELDLDIVGGAYRKKSDRYDVDDVGSYVLNMLDDEAITTDGGYFPVKDIGTGFLLIKRQVFEKMRDAHPEWNCRIGNEGEKGTAFFDTHIEPTTREYLSEDWVFCRRWRAMGGAVHCLASCTLTHFGTYGFKGNLAQALFQVDYVMPDDASSGLHAEFARVRRGEYDVPGVGDVRSVLDIGANVGAFACWAHERFPGATITCVEPHPEMVRYLEQNAPFAHIIPKAAVDTDTDTITMREGRNIGCTGVHDNGEQNGDAFDAPVIRPQSLPRAEFVKLDTEGCELEILQAYDLSETKAVALEYHRDDDRAIKRLLERNGFAIVEHKRLTPKLGTLKAVRQ